MRIWITRASVLVLPFSAGCALDTPSDMTGELEQNATETGHGSVPVYMVPATIPADCSTAADTAIMKWLAAVPSYSIAQFRAGGCYGIDTGIVVTGRANLTIDGNGATFRALTIGTPGRTIWRLQSHTNIVLKNMVIRGANPKPGITDTGPYYNGVDYEWQHG